MIDKAGIPVIAGNMASLREHAMMIAVAGTGYIDTGERVHTTWQGLRPHYIAPEAGQLLVATGPVATVCRHVGTNLQQARDALVIYADTVETIQGELELLRTRATDVNAAITTAGDDWRSDHDLVDRAAAVNDAISAQAVAFEEAQRVCANALRALHGQPPLTVDNGDGVIDPATEFGYTIEQYQAAARADTDQGGGLPWGSVAEPDHPWYVDVATAPVRFVGGLGDSVVNTAIGLGALFGYDHSTGSVTGATAGAAWTNLGKLVLAAGTYALPAAHVHDRLGTMPFLEPGEAGQILTDTGKALIAYDQWDDDPARAAGNAVGNIVLAVVGTKGAGAGLRGAGAALQLTRHGSFTARTGAAVTRAGEAIGRLPTLTDLAGNAWRHLRPPDPPAIPDAPPAPGSAAPREVGAGSIGDDVNTGTRPATAVAEAPSPRRSQDDDTAIDRTNQVDAAPPERPLVAAGAPSPAAHADSSGPVLRAPDLERSPSRSDGATDNPTHETRSTAPAVDERSVPTTAAHHIDDDLGLGGEADVIPGGGATSFSDDVRTFDTDLDAANYGANYWNDHVDTLPEPQRTALHDYTMEPPHVRPTYREINGYLRGQRPTSPEIIRQVEQIDAALASRPLAEDVQVTRATGVSYLNVDPPDLVGTVVEQPSYLSTSLGGPAPAFASSEAVLHLRAPAGTPAIWVERVSEFGGAERELLLGRGLRYRVTRVESVAGQWQMYGEILPPR